MSRATNEFEEMGYEREMGADKERSISGVMSTKACSTDVDRSKHGLAFNSVLVAGEGKRHGSRKGKARKASRR